MPRDRGDRHSEGATFHHPEGGGEMSWTDPVWIPAYAGGASFVGGIIGSIVAPMIARRHQASENAKEAERVRAMVAPLCSRIIGFIDQCQAAYGAFTPQAFDIEAEVQTLQKISENPSLLLKLEPQEISALQSAFSASLRFIEEVRHVNRIESAERTPRYFADEDGEHYGADDAAAVAKPHVMAALRALERG